MHGNDTENRAIVHGLNTHVITNSTGSTSHTPQDDIVDAEWSDINPPYNANQIAQSNNVDLSTIPPHQQEKIISDLFNMAGPNETVSLTISRRPTVTQQPTQHTSTQHTNRYAYDLEEPDDETTDTSQMMLILWMLLCLVVIVVVIKIIEFIQENPITVLLGLITIVCLVGAYFLSKPNRGKQP